MRSNIGKLVVMTAERCAWRAVYLYWGDTQVFAVGVDPSARDDVISPELFWRCGAATILRRIVKGSHRVRLPHVPWSWCARTNYAWPVMLLYRLSSWFWSGVDGRYGWGNR